MPLKAVRRIIDSGLLQGAVKKRKGRRTIQVTALAGLKLAWETAGILTLEGRREHVHAARIYARAYPRGKHRRREPSWRKNGPRSSITIPFNKLPRVS